MENHRLILEKGAFLKAGNFMVSVGKFDSGEVALISRSSGDFVKLSMAKRSKTLKKIKSKFRAFINSDETFTFSHFGDGMKVELLKALEEKHPRFNARTSHGFFK